MRDGYKDWLAEQGYADNTQVAQLHRVQKIETVYGDLAERLLSGKYNEVIVEMTYSRADERQNRANPSRIEFSGNIRNNLQSYKNAAVRYRRFLEGNDTRPSFQSQNVEVDNNTNQNTSRDVALPDKQRLHLERDMQTALRGNVEALEHGLTVVDDGAERSVTSGFIDILCEDQNGAVVVVELKAGKTDSRVVAQILGYMGDLMDEDPETQIRGIIVAHSFDRRTLSAIKAVPNLCAYTYAVEFAFEQVGA